MNFLAHLVLSPGGEKIMAGNFFADRVKGNLWKTLEPSYAAGVLLHRRIDSFTDSHLRVKAAKQLLDPSYGLFRGVLLDVFWDHFLARDFALYTEGLDPVHFAQNAHRVLSAHALVFHPQAGHIVQAMERGNWLLGYAEIAGVDRVLKQMAQRFPYNNPMAHGAKALESAYTELEETFAGFWPDLKEEFGLYSLR